MSAIVCNVLPAERHIERKKSFAAESFRLSSGHEHETTTWSRAAERSRGNWIIIISIRWADIRETEITRRLLSSRESRKRGRQILNFVLSSARAEEGETPVPSKYFDGRIFTVAHLNKVSGSSFTQIRQDKMCQSCSPGGPKKVDSRVERRRNENKTRKTIMF